MENISLILIKYILGFGLQSFLMVLGVYTFNKQKVKLKEYLITAILVSIMTYVTKLLPITVGVQTIINMIFMYLSCVIFLKMQPYKTIRSTFICVLMILISEIVVTAGAVMISGQDQFQIMIQVPLYKYIIGVLANLIFSIIIMSFYFMQNRKGDYHGSASVQDS